MSYTFRLMFKLLRPIPFESTQDGNKVRHLSGKSIFLVNSNSTGCRKMPAPPRSLHRLQKSLCSDAWSTSFSASLTLVFTGMCDVLLFLKYILIEVPPRWLMSPAVSCSGPFVELTGTIYVVFSQRPTLQLTAAKMGA